MDAATPGHILEALAAEMEKHYEAYTSEFAKAPKASFTGVADPMKVQLSVSFDLTHNGESAPVSLLHEQLQQHNHPALTRSVASRDNLEG